MPFNSESKPPPEGKSKASADYPLEIPTRDDDTNGPALQKWYYDLRTVLGRNDEELGSLADDVANLQKASAANLASEITALTERIVALEGGIRSKIIDADVAGNAAIKESKIALNFSTHSSANDPTASQKAALIGSSPPPSGGNPYVTSNDPRLQGLNNLDVPCGTVLWFAGTTIPLGYLECLGQSLARAGLYAPLFAVLGTTYGSVDADHFTLPDLQGRAMVGVGSGSGLTARAAGDVFGAEQVTLVKEQLPDIAPAEVVNLGQAGPSATKFYPVADQLVLGVTSSMDGGDKINPRGVDGGGAGLSQTATDIVQPSLALTAIIKCS